MNSLRLRMFLMVFVVVAAAVGTLSSETVKLLL